MWDGCSQLIFRLVRVKITSMCTAPVTAGLTLGRGLLIKRAVSHVADSCRMDPRDFTIGIFPRDRAVEHVILCVEAGEQAGNEISSAVCVREHFDVSIV